MNLLEAKRIESQNLKEVTKEFSRLFRTETFTDDQKFLEQYGIFIPGKKNFPKGYIKLWPQDFIVEEIALDGELQTIYQDKFLSKIWDFSFDEPVIGAVLVKCGLSTIEAVEELAKDLRIEKGRIKYAGIKDKHAITSQLISIKGADVEKLHELSAPYLFVKNVFSERKELFIGGLKGDQFTILIRTEYTLPEKEFSLQIKEVQKNGFYNFYYLHRFGFPRLINHYCALNILKGDYEEAVKTVICRPGQKELPYFQNLRKEIEKLWGKWEETEEILESFPFTFRNERELVNYLIKNPKDFTGALNQIPKIVQYWFNSFTALLFNQKLSLYLKENQNPPSTIPLLSSDKKDWFFYKELLKNQGVFSIDFALKNLQAFSEINLKPWKQKTIGEAEALDYKIIPQGVLLNFTLPKDCHVNTFLSHLFNLVSGPLPEKFSKILIDIKASLKKPSLEETLNRFQEIVYLPSWKYPWRT